jgi:hypothetical protein
VLPGFGYDVVLLASSPVTKTSIFYVRALIEKVMVAEIVDKYIKLMELVN